MTAQNKPLAARTAAHAVSCYGSRDPFEIAEREGVTVCSYDLGSLNGMYTVLCGVPFIALSESLDRYGARLVCAHELGHHMLHRALAETTALHDSEIFSGGGRLENEANEFAAELLISDRKLLCAVRDFGSLSAVAAELGECEELVAVKSELLRSAGSSLRQMDVQVDFLKKNFSKND